MSKEFSNLRGDKLDLRLVDYNFDLREFLINECDRLITIFKPTTIYYVHIHKGKRIHINSKQAILAHPTMNRRKQSL